MSAEAWFGAGFWPYLGLTLVLFAAAAVATGQALAASWRPQWQIVPYVILLALGDRFLLYALYAGDLFAVGGTTIAALILGLVAFAAYRRVEARLMVQQYPWLYERAGWFGWRPRQPQ